MDRRRYLAAVGTAAVALPLSGCLGLTRGEGEYDVGMTASAFRPAELTVSVGETVVWKNTSSRMHTVTAYEGGLPDGADYFASGGYDSENAARDAWYDSLGGGLSTNDTFSHTFEVAGEYPYFCIPHEAGGMVGSVTVE